MTNTNHTPPTQEANPPSPDKPCATTGSRRRRRSLIALGFALCVAVAFSLVMVWVNGSSTAQTDAQTNTPPDLTHTATVPLNQGQLDVGLLFHELGRAVGWEQDASSPGTWDMKVDLTGSTGQRVLDDLRTATRGIVSYDLDDASLTLRFDRAKLRREEKSLRVQFRSKIEAWFPQAAAEAKKKYGLWLFTADDTPPTRPHTAAMGQDAVVLVHGLDDPGRVWMTLRPRLLEEGYTVLQFEYPNDQPIDDSSQLFADAMRQLKALGVRRVQVIAHSMGGLVSRHLLTDSRWYAGNARGHEQYPDVARLIMVGTPQRGSQWARLHLAAEVRDQVVRLFSEDVHVLDGLFDGAGEAKLDLLPGSDFLHALNSQPLPHHVPITIIAGRISPYQEDQINQTRQQIEQLLGDDPESLEEISATLTNLASGMGDGVVSLDSTPLVGVEDYTVVNGTHLSIIRNVLASSTRVPPAVPIILDKLGHAPNKSQGQPVEGSSSNPPDDPVDAAP